LTGPRKAAILLASLNQEATSAILQNLSAEEVHEVARELSNLSHVSNDDRASVLQEFVEMAGNQDMACVGGFEHARSALVSAFGAETGMRMAEKLVDPTKLGSSPIDMLRRADPEYLAKVIHSEHPQVVALVLCQLDTTAAARLLSALPPELRPDVTRRAAALDQVSPEVLDRIARSITAKLESVTASSLLPSGGVRVVAELLNQVDPSTTDEILTSIGAEDPQLDQAIRHLMFVFEDLLQISQDSLRTLLGRIDKKLLTTALKGSTPALKKHFTSLMSSRAADMLNEDMQALGPVRIKDVEEAQQKIVATAKQLQSEGVVSLKSGAAEEFVE
jgi:flagellar motor switch protein FliG